MGCACKVARDVNTRTRGSSGDFMDLLGSLSDLLITLINKLIVIVLFVILTPIIILCLIFSFVFKGRLTVRLPFKLKKAMRDVDRNGGKLEMIKKKAG